MDQIQETQTQETSTHAPSEQGPAQDSQPQSTSSVEGVVQQNVPPPAYTPNYKYKVNNQEREIAEWARTAIKDSESEKRFRELFEKADGLDVVKPRFHEYRDKYRSLEQEHTGLQTELSQLFGLKEKDLGSFFENLQLPKEKVFQWVLDQLNYQQLPPEQRQVMEARKQAESRAEMLEQQYHQMQQQVQQQAVHARTVELSFAVSQPEVKSFADSFDAKAGQPGAFQDEVIRIGRQLYLDTGRDVNAMEAVKAAMDHYGRFIGTPQMGQQAQMGTQATPQATKTVANQKPPVIPVVNGRSSSPTEPVVKTVEDLQKLYNEKYGN